MNIPGYVPMVLLVLASTPALLAQVDAREISCLDSVAADERNWRIARNYRFLQRVKLRRLDTQGRVEVIRGEDVRHNISGGHALQPTRAKRRPPVARHRREEGAGEFREKHRRTTARDHGGASEAPLSFPSSARIGSGRPWHELADASEFRLAGEGRLDDAPPSSSSRQRRARDMSLDPALRSCFAPSKARFWVAQQITRS